MVLLPGLLATHVATVPYLSSTRLLNMPIRLVQSRRVVETVVEVRRLATTKQGVNRHKF